MKYSPLILAALAAPVLGDPNKSLPPLPPWYPLSPWSLTSLSISHPKSGPFPANESSISLTLKNPSGIPAIKAPHASGGGYVLFPPSTGTCDLHWAATGSTPYGDATTSCNSSSNAAGFGPAKWNVTLREVVTDDTVTDLGYECVLQVDLVHDDHLFGSRAYKYLSGSVRLDAGTNLEGECVDGGKCQWKLAGDKPVKFQPVLQACETACG